MPGAIGDVGSAATGVDHPDGGDAHGEVVFDALLDIGHAVVPGEDFDAEEGCGIQDSFKRRAAGNETDIGDAVACWRMFGLAAR